MAAPKKKLPLVMQNTVCVLGVWIHSLERDVGATFSLGLRQASSASILCEISFDQQVNFVSPTTFFF